MLITFFYCSNNQVFIMGGVSDFANTTKKSVAADFASVLGNKTGYVFRI